MMVFQKSLLANSLAQGSQSYAPLADRMRPQRLEDVAGQGHLLSKNKPLRRLLDAGQVHSMVFWGPPGTGKTTLARLIAGLIDAEFIAISAVNSGVKDIRAAVETAQQTQAGGQKTIVFVDEVHRFNKTQQDGFLPWIENGTLIFIGATTENPAFELNNALLSRLRVYVLKALNEEALQAVIQRAITSAQGLVESGISLGEGAQEIFIEAAHGDARKLLGYLEIATDLATQQNQRQISEKMAREAVIDRHANFDKGGDHFYEQISALHKSVRGSNPDAALYWLARMLEGGCDPHYLARRLVRIAAEDIGNADPRALQITLNAWDGFDRLGHPEGNLLLAQAAVYLAVAAKSNAIYQAYNQAITEARETGSATVPIHLRNAPTVLQKNLGYGRKYRYDHDEPGSFSAGQTYFPDEMGEREYYHPGETGLEQRIAERLRVWRQFSRERAT